MEKNSFIPAEFQTDNYSYNEIHKKYGMGLTTAQYHDSSIYFGTHSLVILINFFFQVTTQLTSQ